MKTKEKVIPKFGVKDQIGYVCGDMAGSFVNLFVDAYFLTFCTYALGIKASWMEGLFLVARLWDAINDPLIGSLIDSDKRKYKLGKYKTYILIGALGLVVGGAAVFLPFPKADVVVKSILFIVGYIVWDAAYTVANVPYGTMLNIVTEDAGERAQLSVFIYQVARLERHTAHSEVFFSNMVGSSTYVVFTGPRCIKTPNNGCFHTFITGAEKDGDIRFLVCLKIVVGRGSHSY